MSAETSSNLWGNEFRQQAAELRKRNLAAPDLKDLVFGSETAAAKNAEPAAKADSNERPAQAVKQPSLSAMQVRTLLLAGPTSLFARFSTSWGDCVATANLGRIRSNDEVSVSFVNRGRFSGTNTCELSTTLRITNSGMSIIEQDRRCSILEFQFFPLRRSDERRAREA